jgi:hypothetical protein
VFLKTLRGAITVVLAAAGVLALPSVAHADESCPDGYVCIWYQANYQGQQKIMLGANYGGFWVGNNGSPWLFSLKNKFTNRAVLTAAYEGQSPLSTCTNPGLNRPFPPAFRLVYVSHAGQRCSDFGM